MTLEYTRRYLDALSNLSPGARTSYPKPLQAIVDSRPAIAAVYIDPTNTLDLIVGVLHITAPKNTKFKEHLGITKADTLAYRASFCDVPGVRIIPAIVSNSRSAAVTVESIERQHKSIDRPLRVDEQLQLALEASGNDLARAVLGLAVGTRHMARAMDRKVMPPDFELDESRMVDWKRGLAPISGEPSEDTAGNNYHFWEGVVAGMSSDEGCDPKSVASLKARTCRTIHANTARITEVLRYRLNRNTGETHHFADTLGLNVGIALANQTNYEQLLQV